jgi:thiol-disulfide isomerase/thioredoxin
VNTVKFKRWMLAGAKYVLLAAMMIGAVGYYQQRNIASGTAPPLLGETLDGEPVDLWSLTARGPVLIYFWASWCGYCRAVSPAIDELAHEHQVLTVALQSGSEEEVAGYLERHGWSFTTINDPEGRIFAEWGGAVTPTIIIVNSSGEIHSVTTGITSKWGLLFRLWRAR